MSNYQIQVSDNKGTVGEVRMPSDSIHAMLEGITFGGVTNVTIPLYAPEGVGFGPIATLVISRDPVMPSPETVEAVSPHPLTWLERASTPEHPVMPLVPIPGQDNPHGDSP